MIDDDEDLCPDEYRDDFEYAVNQIVEMAQFDRSSRQSLMASSKVKRELEQLDKALGRLSFEANAALYTADEGATIFGGPIVRMQRLVRKAMDSIPKGRPKFEFARFHLGYSAAALWDAHGGDINSDKFIIFLEGLIEGAGLGGMGKARVDSNNLAREMREMFAKSGPPIWRP